MVFGSFACDDGNLADGDGCDSYCRVEKGYTCGGGQCGGLPNNIVPDTCQEICGDGIQLGHYGCDDGNLNNGDGCD